MTAALNGRELEHVPIDVWGSNTVNQTMQDQAGEGVIGTSWFYGLSYSNSVPIKERANWVRVTECFNGNIGSDELAGEKIKDDSDEMSGVAEGSEAHLDHHCRFIVDTDIRLLKQRRNDRSRSLSRHRQSRLCHPAKDRENIGHSIGTASP